MTASAEDRRPDERRQMTVSERSLGALAASLEGWLAARATGLPGPGAAVPAALTRLLPYATVAVAAFVPLACVLYLVTSTAWTLAERALLQRPRASARRVKGAGRRGDVAGG